jgi:hypothetical protein
MNINFLASFLNLGLINVVATNVERNEREVSKPISLLEKLSSYLEKRGIVVEIMLFTDLIDIVVNAIISARPTYLNFILEN